MGEPLAGVSAMVLDGAGAVLLVRRGKAPYRGFWSLPGGLIEAGETAEAAAAREVMEETAIAAHIVRPIRVVDLGDPEDPSRPTYRITVFLAEYAGGTVAAGSDAAEAGWFRPDEIATLSMTPGTADLIAAEMPRRNG